MRELALGMIQPRECWRVLTKEAGVGLINGVVLGLLLGTVALLWLWFSLPLYPLHCGPLLALPPFPHVPFRPFFLSILIHFILCFFSSSSARPLFGVFCIFCYSFHIEELPSSLPASFSPSLPSPFLFLYAHYFSSILSFHSLSRTHHSLLSHSSFFPPFLIFYFPFPCLSHSFSLSSLP